MTEMQKKQKQPPEMPGGVNWDIFGEENCPPSLFEAMNNVDTQTDRQTNKYTDFIKRE